MIGVEIFGKFSFGAALALGLPIQSVACIPDGYDLAATVVSPEHKQMVQTLFGGRCGLREQTKSKDIAFGYFWSISRSSPNFGTLHT